MHAGSGDPGHNAREPPGIPSWPSPTTTASARRWSCSRAGSARSSSGSSRARARTAPPPRSSRYLGEDRLNAKKPIADKDVAALLKLMWESWNDVFRLTLGPAERSLVSELRDHRNRWAHQEAFSGDDAYRVLDSAGRLLNAVSAPQADDIEKMKTELLRIRFDEQARNENEERRHGDRGHGGGGLKPWRGGDAAPGRRQRPLPAGRVRRRPLAGPPRPGDGRVQEPRRVLSPHVSHREPEGDAGGAVRRLAGQGGDPVVQLQTNFGGGKTHSMLALYHLFSGIAPRNCWASTQ